MVCRPLLCSGQYGDLIVSLNYVEGLFIKNSRRKAWVDYPQGWAAIDPDHGPHVLKKAAEAAIAGGDVSGHNVPGGAEFAARARDANERAGRTVGSSGPYLDEARSDPLNGRGTDPNCGAGEYSAAGAGKRWFGEHRQKRAGAIARFRYGLGNEFYARGPIPAGA